MGNGIAKLTDSVHSKVLAFDVTVFLKRCCIICSRIFLPYFFSDKSLKSVWELFWLPFRLYFVLDEELKIAESMSLAVFLSLQQDQDHQEELQQVLQSIHRFYLILAEGHGVAREKKKF